MIEYPPGFSALELSKLLDARLSAALSGGTRFTSLSDNSAKLKAGALFVALCGEKHDGNAYAEEALRAGALAVVSDQPEKMPGLPALFVADARAALSELAYQFSGRAADGVRCVALTGTNGKTTTNWLIFEALRALGEPSARLGTLGAAPSEVFAEQTSLTTPGALQLHELIMRARKHQIKFLVAEASSHALDQHRIDHLPIEVGVFTNLTRDHLDYHGSMQQYFSAKLRLFELCARRCSGAKAAVINIDCEYGRQMLSAVRSLGLNVLSVGKRPEAHFQIAHFEQNFAGSEVTILHAGKTFQIASGFIGEHNAHNLTAALAALCALGFDIARAASTLEQVPQVPGRLESVRAKERGVYVDYAHSPDALHNVLKALKPLTKGKLWVIFGCGGDRDRGKRPEMARAAAELADAIVVTSDNPRSEDPQRIIADILAAGITVAHTDPDRRAAINHTLAASGPGDIVLIAGKGHEDYQIIGTHKAHFSDVEEAQKALAGLGMGTAQ